MFSLLRTLGRKSLVYSFTEVPKGNAYKPIILLSTEKRLIHTEKVKTSDELNSHRLDSLKALAHKEFLDSKALKNKEKASEKAFEIVSTVKTFQDSIYQYSKLHPEKEPLIMESNQLLGELLQSKKITFDEALLTKIFKLEPKYPTLKTVIEAYYSQDAKLYIPVELATIPFRRLLWDASFQDALNYIELTTGSQRYFTHRKTLIKRYIGYFGGSMAGLIGSIHAVVLLFYPQLLHSGTGGTHFGIYGIYAMIVTYFVNCGFLATMAFSSRGMENGSLLFEHGTMPWDWFQKVDEMEMCAKVLEADAAIHGAEGFATRPIVSRINLLGFVVNEPEQEVMMRQYWYSSGEGFTWVEPDLDPAEIQWWNHLKEIGVKKFWDKDYVKIESSSEVGDEGDQDDLILPDK